MCTRMNSSICPCVALPLISSKMPSVSTPTTTNEHPLLASVGVDWYFQVVHAFFNDDFNTTDLTGLSGLSLQSATGLSLFSPSQPLNHHHNPLIAITTP